MSDTRNKISEILQELGIPDSHISSCGLPLQQECSSLVDAEPDVFGRQPRLDAEAFAAWRSMQAAAREEGIELQIVSAYRSIEYQKELFLRKLARGDSLESILKVNAVPGYSEHHSGRALDLGTPGSPYLEEVFDQTPAFAWLQANAARFGFFMSFPHGNGAGVVYEPWHWCYRAGCKEEGRRKGRMKGRRKGLETEGVRKNS